MSNEDHACFYGCLICLERKQGRGGVAEPAPVVYSDQDDNEWLGESDPSDPDDWSNT